MCDKCSTNIHKPRYYQQGQRRNVGRAIAHGIGLVTGQAVPALAINLIGSFLNGIMSTEPEQPVKEEVVAPPEKKVKEEVKEELTDDEIKNEIQNKLLKDKIVDLDEATLNELVDKYKQIKAADPEYSDELLSLRLQNFVMGKMNHMKSVEWANRENNFIKKEEEATSQQIATALSNNTDSSQVVDLTGNGNTISIDKLRALSLQYIRYADANNDETIDLVEFYRNDLISYYQVYENLNIDAATKKADEKIKELNLKTNQDVIDLAHTCDANSEKGEEITLAGSLMYFTTLNQTDSDFNLDINEVMAYYAAMANFNTDDNKLDNGDFSLFNNSIIEDMEITLDNGETVNKTEHMLKGYYNAIINYS
jgi:hypothetical protein